MRKLLALTTLLLMGCATTQPAAPLWTLDDPAGDDYGNGRLEYPMNADYVRGDLDLVRLSAFRVPGGTEFEAEFARPIRKPERRTIDAVGTQLDDVAKLGFYTFNIDIYVDTDGVVGSGSVATLPGRVVRVDDATAWEKVISLTPDPDGARLEMRRIVVREERRRMQGEGRKGIIDDDDREELQGSVDEKFFFPSNVRVAGKLVSFFVPDSFLGGAASAGWSYVVAVTGADVIQRHDQANRFLRRGDPAEALMILPAAPGRPADRFGGALEHDTYFPPIVDLIVPDGVDQKKVLSDYDADADVPALVKGVRP